MRGGNVDRERFLSEVLLPLSRGACVEYRRFDCGTQTLLPPERVTPTPLCIVEGAYAMHPDLSASYTLSVFLDITPEAQRERILLRNSPPFAERHFHEWIPKEEAYFRDMHVRERCDLCIPAVSAQDLS